MGGRRSRQSGARGLGLLLARTVCVKRQALGKKGEDRREAEVCVQGTGDLSLPAEPWASPWP